MIDTFLSNSIQIINWLRLQLSQFVGSAPLLFVVLGIYLFLSLFVVFIRSFIRPK